MRKRIIISVACLVVCSFSFSGCGKRERSKDAWVCAENVVEEQLKSPSTAKFCSYPDARITDMGDDRYKIEGYVYAENSFGAEIRTDFTVTLTLTKSGYKDESCRFNSNSINSDSESDDMKEFISNYIDEHPEEYNKTDESNNAEHNCAVSGCTDSGIYSIVGISGETEYYCYNHYQKMKKMMDDMFGDN